MRKYYRARTIALILLIISGILHLSCGKKSTSNDDCLDLAIVISGEGDVNYEPEQLCYDPGDELFLTATPDDDWAFYKWTGNVLFNDGAEYESNIVVTFGTANMALAANFRQQLSLTVNIEPFYAGYVDIEPDWNYYIEDDTVTLEAFPSSGYEFFHWIYEGEIHDYNPAVLTFGSFYEEITAVFARLEAELDCGDGYVDTYNGGCNSIPPIFQNIDDGDIILGTSGNYTYLSDDWRDTDWYEYDVYQTTELTFTATTDFLGILFIIDGTFGCDDYVILEQSDTTSVEDTLTISAIVSPGTYWMFVAPAVFTGWPCPLEYTAWFTAEPVSGLQATQSRPISKDLLSNRRIN
ncbi:MAG: hypothetical protein GY839_13430 [candidate division Zixibacteria bacterium]|nr:hypothetical protein [candidate division Zixibacteria bacterium]